MFIEDTLPDRSRGAYRLHERVHWLITQKLFSPALAVTIALAMTGSRSKCGQDPLSGAMRPEAYFSFLGTNSLLRLR